jgi:cobyrinic acid a,c-diamide synthase
MMPRLVIAGTQSGAGKTTITAGLIAALASRGLQVQGFKTGPDYVDPQCHRWASGRPGRNLDTWLMSPAQVRAGFLRGAAGADIAIIEGVMGLYDGAAGGAEAGSTAHLAKLLKAPVVLVLDARASARSAAAVALGFKLLDPQVDVVGVICNRVGSPRHAQMLGDALESIGLPMLGALPQDDALRIPEGRLGLTLPGGQGAMPEWIGRAEAAVTAHLDLDRLLGLAATVGGLPAYGDEQTLAEPFSPGQAGRYGGLRVAVPLDEAFWFYYEDTFDLMRYWGVEPVLFSLLHGDQLPAGVDGLYIGGGYPERHAAALAANGSMQRSVRAAVAAGLPTLAEGGGYLYLLQGLTAEDGTVCPMAGSIAGVARLQGRLQAMGYRTAEPGAVRGHVFHYTRVEETAGAPAWRLFRSGGDYERDDGYCDASILAGYLHVHHATQPQVLAQFLDRCGRRTRGGQIDE